MLTVVTSSISSRRAEQMVKKIRWFRLIWLVLLGVYCLIFFYNFLSPFPRWPTTYVMTMVLVLWLSVEYYQKHFFFQSGFFKFNRIAILFRSLFGLYFYAMFVVGNGAPVWWPANRVGLYPYFEIVGICMLVYAIRNRLIINRQSRIDGDLIRRFYANVAFFVIAMAIGYGSLIMIASLIIGLPLIYGQYRTEIAQMNQAENAARDAVGRNEVSVD